MRKVFSAIAFLLAASTLSAAEPEGIATEAEGSYALMPDDETLQAEEINHFTSAVMLSPGWDSNWYVGVAAGASSFIGTPMGGGMFSRIKPLFALEIGKWYTPTVGSRLAIQGFRFKDSENITNKYEFLHLDFLYNLTRLRKKEYTGPVKNEFIPFFGIGFIHNSDFRMSYNEKNFTGDNHPFAISLGMIYRHRLNDRVSLKGELGLMTTFQSFDSNGVSNKFGDFMLNASIGLNIGLGKQGWRHVVVERGER